MFLFDPPENIRKPFQVGQKETLGREGLSHLRQVFHSYKNRDFFFFFFFFLLATPRPTGLYRGSSLTNPILITAYTNLNPMSPGGF